MRMEMMIMMMTMDGNTPGININIQDVTRRSC